MRNAEWASRSRKCGHCSCCIDRRSTPHPSRLLQGQAGGAAQRARRGVDGSEEGHPPPDQGNRECGGLQHGRDQVPGDGGDRRGPVPGGPGRAKGRHAVQDRPAVLRGGPATGRGCARTGPRPGKERGARSAALRGAGCERIRFPPGVRPVADGLRGIERRGAGG